MIVTKLNDNKPNDNTRLFLERVVEQLSSSDSFCKIIDIRDSFLFDSKKIKSFLNYLQENVCMREGLNIQSRFEVLSDTCQFNIVTLLCELEIDVPKEFLINETLKMFVESFSEPPKIIQQFTGTSLHEEKQAGEEMKPAEEEIVEEEPPQIESQPMTADFFNDIENSLIKYPRHKESLIIQYLNSSNVKNFHDTCKLFFAVDRSQEAIDAFVEFYILPYIRNLKNLANRLVVEPLLSFAKHYPNVVATEIFSPLFFDQASTVNQFQLMKSLFEDKGVQEIALKTLFEGRPPSLEGPLSDEAMKWLVAIVPKTPRLDDASVENILLHIKTQMEHQKKDAARCFMLFIKVQNINESNRAISEDMIALLPEIMQSKAIELMDK